MLPVNDAPNGEVTIIVLAKLPVPKFVKTRLCPPCTPVEAAQIAEASLIDTLDAVVAARSLHPELVREVVLCVDRLGRVAPDWMAQAGRIVDQCDGGLADRLEHAFGAVEGPAILIGMDTPQVTAELLVESLRTLGGRCHDSVIGLAKDGGFWIIGFRRCPPNVFRGVPMSTDHTGDDQLIAMSREGLTPEFLPALTDFDTFAHAVEMASLVPGSRVQAAVRSVSERLSRANSELTTRHVVHSERP